VSGFYRVTGLAAIVSSLIVGGSSVAQPTSRPPPPVIDYDARDRSKPHLRHNHLDYSFCEYPSEAISAGVEGCCRMKVDITATGLAGKMSGQCTDDVFMPVSRACLAPQRFLPALKNGKPVSGTGEIVVEYKLAEDRSVVEAFFSLFGVGDRSKAKPTPEICKKRPGDLIAGMQSTG
jgi:hypothetical protein